MERDSTVNPAKLAACIRQVSRAFVLCGERERDVLKSALRRAIANGHPPVSLDADAKSIGECDQCGSTKWTPTPEGMTCGDCGRCPSNDDDYEGDWFDVHEARIDMAVDFVDRRIERDRN
jgi:hypothetical protein